MDHSTGAEAFPKSRILRVVRIFRLFLSIEVIEVAEELIKPVLGGQKFIAIPKMVLSELSGGIALLLQQGCKCDVLRPDTEVSAGHPHLGQAGADRRLARDKRGAPRGTTLLPVVIGEFGTFSSDAINIRCLITHHAHVVGRQIPEADIVTPDHENVRAIHCQRGATEYRARERDYLDKTTQHSAPPGILVVIVWSASLPEHALLGDADSTQTRGL